MIRKIEKNDREMFFSLSRTFYGSNAVLEPVPENYHEAAFGEMMRSDLCLQGFLLEQDGEAAGYALISLKWSHAYGGRVLWLEELFVCPEHRGKGLGRALLKFIEQKALALSCARVRLEVEPDNIRAWALYENFGFEALNYAQMILELPQREEDQS